MEGKNESEMRALEQGVTNLGGWIMVQVLIVVVDPRREGNGLIVRRREVRRLVIR